MKRWTFLISFLGTVSYVTRAAASCGAATCPLDLHKPLELGRLHLMVSYEYINQDQIYVGSNKSYVGALPNPHDEVKTINQRTLLQGQYGLTQSLGVSFALPFIVRDHTHLEGGVPETFKFR